MITTHYRCIIDIVQPVDNTHNINVDEYKKNLDENVEIEFRNSIFDSLCNEDATVTIERLALEFAEY